MPIDWKTRISRSQPFPALRRPGKGQATRHVEADILPTFFLDLAERSEAYACRAAIFGSALRTWIPPAACQEEPAVQHSPLQHADIFPAELCQVIQVPKHRPHPTDNHYPVMRLHHFLQNAISEKSSWKILIVQHHCTKCCRFETSAFSSRCRNRLRLHFVVKTVRPESVVGFNAALSVISRQTSISEFHGLADHREIIGKHAVFVTPVAIGPFDPHRRRALPPQGQSDKTHMSRRVTPTNLYSSGLNQITCLDRNQGSTAFRFPVLRSSMPSQLSLGITRSSDALLPGCEQAQRAAAIDHGNIKHAVHVEIGYDGSPAPGGLCKSCLKTGPPKIFCSPASAVNCPDRNWRKSGIASTLPLAMKRSLRCHC